MRTSHYWKFSLKSLRFMTSRAAILHEFRPAVSVANEFGKRRHKKRQLGSRRIKRYEIMGIGKENFLCVKHFE